MTELNRSELEAAIAKQNAISDGLSERINEMREQKKCEGTAFQNLLAEFSVSEKQVERMEKRLDALTPASDGLTRTGVKLAIEASPSTRFMRAAATKGDGFQGLESWETESQREMIEKNGFEGIRKPTDYFMPFREFSTTTGAQAIPTDTMAKIVQKLVQFGGARAMAQTISTMGGNPLKVPTTDETGSGAVGELLAENATAATYDHPNLTSVTLNAYTYSSKSVDVSKESISDIGANGFDIIGWAMKEAGRRIGRAFNTAYTTGSGTNQPQGMLSSASNGITTNASGGAANIVYSDLVKMVQDIDPAYLQGMEMGEDGASAESGGVVGWQFHNAFLTILMSLTDGDGRSLWAPGLTAMANSPRQSTLLGYPYFVNQAMPSDMSGGSIKNVAIFGNGSFFLVRDVDGVLIRLFDDSGTAPTNSVKILGFARTDSRHIGYGTSAEAYKILRAKS